MRSLQLGWRNLRRNTHRTALTLAGLAVSVAALVCVWAYFDGQSARMVQGMTAHASGHLQVHRRGFDAQPDINLAFHPAEAAGALSALTGVKAVAPRLAGGALLGTQSATRGASVVGIDPAREASVTRVQEHMVAGRYLRPGERGGMVMGTLLAATLGVGLGGEVVVLADGMQAAIGAARYRVVGLYRTGNEAVDSQQAAITLDDADVLFNAEGRIGALVLRLDSLDQVDATVERLGTALGSRFEVLGWRAKLPDVADHVDFHEAMVATVMLLLFLVAAAGMANTMVMAVVERRRELGVLSALGTSPSQLVRTLLCEGLALGVLGLAIGLAAAALVLAALGPGLDVAPQARQALTGIAGPAGAELRAGRVALVAGVLLAMVLAATAGPAWRASRLAPIAALRGAPGGGMRTAGSAARAGPRAVPVLLAWRNLRRTPLRSLLAGGAIAGSLAACLFVGAVAQGFAAQMAGNATGLYSGDLQLQHPAFRAQGRLAHAFEPSPELLTEARGQGAVSAAAPRVQAMGMLGSTVRAEVVGFIGVDAEAERQVTFVHRTLRDGRWLQRERDVVIGQRLAERLRVRPGDRVVAMTQDAQGQLASEAFTVAGVFATGNRELDAEVAYVSLPKLQSLLGLGGRITAIALRLHDRDTLDHVAAALGPVAQRHGLQALPWTELLADVAAVVDQLAHVLALVGAITFALVAVVVANAVLMSVMERRREFGTLLAFGAAPWSIVRMVALEAAMLAAASVCLGVALGGGAAAVAGRVGISLGGSRLAGAAGVTDVLHPQVAALAVAAPAAAVFVLVVVAALYPALKAARLDPVPALRQG